MNHLRIAVAIVAAMSVLTIAAPATTSAAPFDGDAWGPAAPVSEVNSVDADGCPIESPDGRSLYIASTRTGTLGGNDIWVAHRKSKTSPWSAPVNVGAPVNGEANDFCPTPLPFGGLLFVSERPGAETCDAGPGFGDMYITRLRHGREPRVPQHLGCVSDGTGPNFSGPEFSPSLVTTWRGTWLYFSSTGYDGNMDIYVSRLRHNGKFAAPTKLEELSTPGDDRMPNVSADGLKMVFSSDRTDLEGEQGSFDVYVSHRWCTCVPWSQPVNLGPNVNSSAGETRATMSADGERLYFGRLGDIWMSTSVGRH